MDKKPAPIVYKSIVSTDVLIITLSLLVIKF
jgi:hypothetical protein